VQHSSAPGLARCVSAQIAKSEIAYGPISLAPRGGQLDVQIRVWILF
jgi:hypothetical protein